MEPPAHEYSADPARGCDVLERIGLEQDELRPRLSLWHWITCAGTDSMDKGLRRMRKVERFKTRLVRDLPARRLGDIGGWIDAAV